MNSNTKRILAWVALAAGVLILIWIISSYVVKEPPEYTKFVDELYAGKISKVYIDSYSAKVLNIKEYSKVKDEKTFPRKSDYTVNIPNRTEFAQMLENFNHGLDSSGNPSKSKIYERDEGGFIKYDDWGFAKFNETYGKVSVNTSNPSATTFMDFVPMLLIIAVVVVLGVLFFRAVNKGDRQAISFSKSKARLNDNIKVKFTDVAGAEEEKEELAEIVEFLKNPQKFTELGARIPKGVLLVGPPGTGKTLFAKAVAGEANVPFFSISGSDFVEMFVGVGASRVRDLFDQAKKNMPCILFIDEIDAVGRQRGTGLGGGHDEREQTLNQLLVQMDGFETNEGIIIMAATNRADILDPALLRPGRFDRQIYIHVPDVRGRELIFKVHARNKPISPDVDYKVLARITAGLTGADIANILNEAAILAARANRKVIIMEDINEGFNKATMGLKKKSRLVTEFDKRIIAYHESGHAIVAEVLPHADKVHEVSIIGRGPAAGYTMTRPATDDKFDTYNALMDEIAVFFGGRAAEEIIIKDVSSGAQNDIKVATGIAKKMITEYGMNGEIGPVFLGGSQEVFLGRDYQSTHTYSEKLAAVIDAEIRKVVESNHQRAVTILKEKREVLDKMARLLIERETIYAEQVAMLMNGDSLEDIIKSMDTADEAKAALAKNRSAAPVNKKQVTGNRE